MTGTKCIVRRTSPRRGRGNKRKNESSQIQLAIIPAVFQDDSITSPKKNGHVKMHKTWWCSLFCDCTTLAKQRTTYTYSLPLGPVGNFVYLFIPSPLFSKPGREARKINPSTFRIPEPRTRATITRRPCARTYFFYWLLYIYSYCTRRHALHVIVLYGRARI